MTPTGRSSTNGLKPVVQTGLTARIRGTDETCLIHFVRHGFAGHARARVMADLGLWSIWRPAYTDRSARSVHSGMSTSASVEVGAAAGAGEILIRERCCEPAPETDVR